MKVEFVAQVDRIGIGKYEVSSTNPETVLETLTLMGYEAPTVTRLLNHMFVEGAAYCKGNYSIIIRCKD